MEKFYAGGFFYNPDTKSVLLHKRDGNTPYNPHKWAFFGGAGEAGETPEQAWIREIAEELAVNISHEPIFPLTDYVNEEYNTHRYVFYIRSNKDKSEMTLAEGADFDWIPLEKVFLYDLAVRVRNDLRLFITSL